MARVTPWAKLPVTPVPWQASVLTRVSAYWVRLMVGDLEPRKYRALWGSDADFAVGYDAVCKIQEALLMDIGAELKMEIRALRGGDAITAEVRDPASDPFTLPLQTIAGIGNNLDLARAKLEEIRLAIANGTTDSEGIIQAIEALGLLLA